MTLTRLEQIEFEVGQLSLIEQLRLMEHLVRQIRDRAAPQLPDQEAALTAMALDPDIQRELARIQSDFASSESDGLARST